MMELTNKLKFQWKAIWFHIYSIAVSTVFIVFFLGYDYVSMLVLALFFILLSTLPIYLHIEYLFYSVGYKISINDEYIIIESSEGINKISRDSISEVVWHKHINMDKGQIQYFGHESYNYLRLISEGQEDVIITCFMTKDLQNIVNLFPAAKFERKKRVMCAICWDKF